MVLLFPNQIALLPSLFVSRKPIFFLQILQYSELVWLSWTYAAGIQLIYISYALISTFCFLLPHNYWKIILKWSQIYFLFIPICI